MNVYFTDLMNVYFTDLESLWNSLQLVEYQNTQFCCLVCLNLKRTYFVQNFVPHKQYFQYVKFFTDLELPLNSVQLP